MMKRRSVAKHGMPVIVKVLVGFACFVCAIVAVSLAGITYASGFNFSDDAPKRQEASALSQVTFDESQASEADVLKDTNKRDVSSLVSEIKAQEEAKARAEAEAKKKHEDECIARANANKAKAGNPDDGVDFSIGKDAFVSEWGERIDQYLKGSPLYGQGKTFADAAFENGIDPRVSPAISNTESSKGAICFRPFNAWGWGSSGWSSWEEAINAHVKGYAKGYGYTVSVSGAQTYCPPNWNHWYSSTTSQMAKI